MKKMIALILIALMSLAGVTALAEGTSINCLINEGSYVIQIDDPEGDLGWVAASEDESIVNLYDADLIEDTFVARFDPVADGEATVSMKHYTGIACDEKHTFDLVIKNGAVTESAGGSYTASPDPIEQDPYLIGGWDAQDGGVMVITKNPNGRAWDVEITSPLTHGAYTFMTTIYYDCDLDAFVYDKGKFWEVPITEDVNDELGEAKIAGTVGSFTFTGDPENLILTWKDDQHPDEAVDFLRQPSDYTYYPEMEAYVGKWESGDYTLEIVHSDDDYNVMNCIVTQYTGEREGVRWIYDSCSYDDVGKSLTSFQIGMKFTFVNDENGDLVNNKDIYTDGAAAFKLNDDGTLTWTDFKAASGEDEMVFKRTEAPQTQAVIAPQFDGLDTTEGTYSAAFDRNDLKDGVLNNVRIFTKDTYDIVDVAQMAVGDTFEAEGKTITISSLETDEYGDILINGGFEEEGGYTLTTHENTNGWTTTSWDDFCTYTQRDTVNLELAENVTFNDSWDIEKEPVTVSGIEAVSNTIMASENGDFYEHNTELVIEGGKVVEINRQYVP